MNYLGVDLGGTNIACAVVTEKGEMLGKASIPTDLPEPAEEIADRIAICCRKAATAANLELSQIASVGIGAPGIANSKDGIVEYSCNLDFHNTPLSRMVESRLHLPVFLENDANAAALGEYVSGAGRGCHSLVAITLGTGVGGGVVLNNRLLTGFNFAGAALHLRQKGLL